MFKSFRNKAGRGDQDGSAQQQALAGVEATPTADPGLPKGHARRQRRRSSIVRDQETAQLASLPLLKDTAPSKRESLFREKLRLCGVLFNFDDETSNLRGKELKRMTLLELVDHVSTPAGQKIFGEGLMPEVVHMVAVNIFRALPPSTEEFDPEEDEPVLEPSWPHMQVVYEFLLRFVVCPDVRAKVAKRHIDQRFCLHLIELFDSEDPRERDYLKTILHRIYGKFMGHRSFIRKAIANVFYRFVFETHRHNGIGELLEILGSIINGFAVPLKQEHIVFLQKALLPLHRVKMLGNYFQQLTYCMAQFVDKDPALGVMIIVGLIKVWPWSNPQKQVLFLNSLEDLLELLGEEQLLKVHKVLFRVIAKCIASAHFQVAERTLLLWNNDALLSNGRTPCLGPRFAERILPFIIPALEANANHWNTTVESLSGNVLQHYQELDMDLFQRCRERAAAEQRARERSQAERERQWVEVERMARENGLAHLGDEHGPPGAAAAAAAAAGGGGGGR